MGRINVTKAFLPPVEEYEAYVRQIWQSEQLTNQGPLLKEFERQAESYLGLSNLQFVSNGTIALQISLHALGITDGEIITTPFSYVATTSSILWERCKPVFVDIEPDTFCIDSQKIEAAITDRTRAIMPVHVFGVPCDVEGIEKIAKKYSLKVIYDAAHAFGVEYKGKSLLSYGDISTCSFHATKLFHTIEGGAVVTPHLEVAKRVELIKRFGHDGDDHLMLGINAKSNEFQAAMGLVNLKYVDSNIEKRKKIADIYDGLLSRGIHKPKRMPNIKQNYAYYPIVLSSEDHLFNVIKTLAKESVYPRRYFYPSLNKLSYIVDEQSCPISEEISKKILCLPLYADLDPQDARKIALLVNSCDA